MFIRAFQCVSKVYGIRVVVTPTVLKAILLDFGDTLAKEEPVWRKDKPDKLTALIDGAVEVLTELRKPLLVKKITLPESLSYGQVLVKIHYSGVCGSQIGEIDGVKGEDKYLPHLLGHEGSGTVLKIGEMTI